MKEKIRFKGKEYFLVHGEGFGMNEGAMATKKQYANWLISFAHLFEDGVIRRFGEQIGTIEDIEFLERQDGGKA